MNEPRAKELSRWRAEAAASLEAARRELVDLQKVLREHEHRLQLLDDLLALEGAPSLSNTVSSELDDILDASEQIISSNEQPMHIRELHAALVKRGIHIPGKGTEANLIVRLQRSEGRFIRVGRGLYAPRSLQLPEKSPAKVRRVRQGRRGANGG
jgi:hypothetical protein